MATNEGFFMRGGVQRKLAECARARTGTRTAPRSEGLAAMIERSDRNESIR